MPGAFRRAEEVINLVLAEYAPDPRVLEAIPALLAWNDLDEQLLAAHSSRLETTRRLGWLASLTLGLARQNPFPGGCYCGPLERYLELVQPPDPTARWDDLGMAAEKTPPFPIWKRWRINYAAKPAQFLERATTLRELQSRFRSLVRSDREVRRQTTQPEQKEAKLITRTSTIRESESGVEEDG